jgi:putative phosphoribosyl transferase
MNEIIFRDRRHAGQLLAGALREFEKQPDLVVLGLPRGGVPVAAEVARRLEVPLDVMVVRKLGLPGWEELAMGAIASGDVRVLNEKVIEGSGVSSETIDRAAEAELEELHRRELAYRGRAGAPDVHGKTVILVDDGIATGSNIRAAVIALRQQKPAAIIVAVPVAAADTCKNLEPLVDQLVVLMQPVHFRAVGQWYENFGQTTDAEVRQSLEQSVAGAMPDS